MEPGIAPASAPSEIKPETPFQAKRHKSPGLAFGMSLIVPGSGQLYCGKRRGLWTLIVFSIAAGVAAFLGIPKDPTGEMIWGVCLRMALALYAFSFLDAYYTAREVNRDIDLQVDGTNPRVAAILNLVTKGFGYFYLGNRKLGLRIFFVLTVFNVALRSAPEQAGNVIAVLLEIVLAVLAVHGWRLARQKLKETLAMPEEQPGAIRPSELGPALPLAIGGLVAVNYALLVIVGVMIPSYAKIDQRRTSVTLLENQTAVYKNPAYGIEARFPEGWVVTTEATKFFAAEKHDGLCNVQMMAEGELFGGTGHDEVDILKELRKSYPKAYLAGTQTNTLGGHRANEIRVIIPLKNEVEMQQRYLFAHRPLKLDAMALIETYAGENECMSEAEEIRKSIVIGR